MITEIDFDVLQQLRTKGLFTDLTVVVPSANNAEFKTHKIILAASSKYFEEILTKDPSIDRLTLPNPVIPIFSKTNNIQMAYQAILDTMYSSKNMKELINQGLSADNCFTYYSVAASLGLNVMQNAIVEYISSNVLNQANISAILTDSTKMNIPPLMEKCTFHLLQDFGKALNSKEQSNQLLNLPYNDFLKLISRDDIVVDSEDSIFDLVIKYIEIREKAQAGGVPSPATFHNRDPGAPQNPPPPTPANPPQDQPPTDQPPPPPEGAPPIITPVPPEGVPPEGLPPIITPVPPEGTLDVAQLAEELMKIVILTDDQKKNLLLALRYKYISHEKIMKESKNPLLEKFKDILMEGLSAKLKNYEPSSLAFQINTNPRQRYTIDPSITRGIEATIHHQSRKTAASMGGATQKLMHNSLAGHQRPNPTSQLMNNVGLTNKTVPAMMNSGYPKNQGSPPLVESHNFGLPPGFSDALPLPNPNDPYYREGNLSLPQGNYHDKKYKNDGFGQREVANYASNMVKPSGYASTSGSGQPYMGHSHAPLHYSKVGNYDSNSQDGYYQEQDDDLIFTYQYDFDENGAMYYLGTRGRNTEYTNPYSLGEVKVYFSSMGKGSYEDLVGRSLVNCRTLNEPNAFMGIDLTEGRSLIPSCYTIRNRDSSRHIMLNWLFEGSTDFKTWFILDKRIHKTDDQSYNKIMEKERQMIERRGATSTWSVDQNYLKVASRAVVMQSKGFHGFRFFRIKQISKNSSGADNLALSGFEIYGIAKGPNWRLF